MRLGPTDRPRVGGRPSHRLKNEFRFWAEAEIATSCSCLAGRLRVPPNIQRET